MAIPSILVKINNNPRTTFYIPFTNNAEIYKLRLANNPAKPITFAATSSLKRALVRIIDKYFPILPIAD